MELEGVTQELDRVLGRCVLLQQEKDRCIEEYDAETIISTAS